MPKPLAKITHPLAERHEAVFLRVQTLHKDICTLAAKKPEAPVGDTVRATAEGLISDCRPFLAKRKDTLPVAAPTLAGLAVQLGQVLAQLDDFENRHAEWNGRQGCRCWRVEGEPIPIGRLRQSVAIAPLTTFSGEDMRAKLAKRWENQNRQIFENGFQKGLSARQGPPEASAPPADLAEPTQTYPRIRRID